MPNALPPLNGAGGAIWSPTAPKPVSTAALTDPVAAPASPAKANQRAPRASSVAQESYQSPWTQRTQSTSSVCPVRREYLPAGCCCIAPMPAKQEPSIREGAHARAPRPIVPALPPGPALARCTTGGPLRALSAAPLLPPAAGRGRVPRVAPGVTCRYNPWSDQPGRAVFSGQQCA